MRLPGIFLPVALAVACGQLMPPPTSTASPALIAQCQSMAQNFATKCAGDDQRPCLWAGYTKLCTVGQTQLLVDSMNCLDATTCRTFSDANEGATCLASVQTAGETAAAKMFIQTQCAQCGGSNCATAAGTAEIYPYLLDADLSATATCFAATCPAAFPVSCENVPGLTSFACLLD